MLGLALGISRTAVSAGLYEPLGQADRTRFEELVEARSRRIPLAYIRGSQEFYGLDFEVGPAVLIPRPETEMLVDFARTKYAEVSQTAASERRMARFADVGTGSGCIAIAILAACADTTGVAFERDPRALSIARRNAVRHSVAGRLTFVCSDLLSGARVGSFDLILSNPPYVPTAALAGLEPEVRDAEPRLALDGGVDGLSPYRRLVPMAQRSLAPGGWLAVEVGQGQAGAVADLMADAKLRNVAIRNDLAGIGRTVAAQRGA